MLVKASEYSFVPFDLLKIESDGPAASVKKNELTYSEGLKSIVLLAYSTYFVLNSIGFYLII
jgi:hypothetical protein